MTTLIEKTFKICQLFEQFQIELVDYTKISQEKLQYKNVFELNSLIELIPATDK